MENNKDGKIEFQYKDYHFEVTCMVGKTVAAAIEFISQEIGMPVNVKVKVFTFEVRDNMKSYILENEPGMLMKNIGDRMMMLQGYCLVVSGEYVFTRSDLKVVFEDVDSENKE